MHDAEGVQHHDAVSVCSRHGFQLRLAARLASTAVLLAIKLILGNLLQHLPLT
jgi:hypothetical protein